MEVLVAPRIGLPIRSDLPIRAILYVKKSPADEEPKVVVASPSKVSEPTYLRVLFLVHIGRDGKDTTIEADLVTRYARHFVSENWPGQRIPEMYYDPRGLEMVPA